ncbi:MACPF domain-containing protein At4g24290-like [Prosopis cineraria]|uniref:MACPF domain-containing protein At4g24290-like n=1 Tax=Prosopis cineraria TaxID=364024 RepID=UPI00240F9898|nr:MACPF domain-containing protein At4g24290-like [Prosopis cineraria]
MASRDSRLRAGRQAIDSIGQGFDITQVISFNNCKKGSSLMVINEEQSRNLEIPGGVSIPNVPISIKCVGGESLRIHSDVLSLQQMLEHFNQEMCLGGRTASGNFCASFGMSDRCVKDFDSIKFLAYDGWFIKRYTVELEKHQGELDDHVKEAVPSSWDPEALARFIEEFGTHVVVGVSMGGKDVLYLRQSHSSNLQPSDLQKLLKDKADMRFMGSAENSSLTSEDICYNDENVVVVSSRRGGSTEMLYHKEWFDTVDLEPDVISMFLVPLTSLLKSIRGSGFVCHAINLYLQYKPPIKDLHQFFEFQLPRHWAPVLSEIRLGARWKQQVNTWLTFGFFGPKLYIDTIPVDVGNRPVIGLRLQLEGRTSNRLAIHLQHLASLPKSFPLSDNENAYLSCNSYNCTSHQKVCWNSFSYVCTAPVESDDALSIVTGAQLQVENKCLFLRLRFSKVIGSTSQKKPEWEPNLDNLSHKSWRFCGIFTEERQKGHPKPGDVTIGSTTYSAARPLPVHTPKLLRFVDTKEMVRGPEDSPGYWVVSGARLALQYGKIYLMVKYSLLNLVMLSETDAL